MNWTTILTFTYPHEAQVIKGRLESEGIEVLLKDELSAQINNFYSNAIGGVKLQVQEKDVERSTQLLKDAGYINEEKESEKGFLFRFDASTSGFPVIGKWMVEMRLLTITAIVLLLILIPIFVLTLPSKYEQFEGKTWCVDSIHFKGKKYRPKSINETGNIQLKVTFGDNCMESIRFDDGRESVSLPGVNTREIKAQWDFIDNNLLLSNADTLAHVYNGSYDVDVNSKMLKLESENTIIIAYPLRIYL